MLELKMDTLEEMGLPQDTFVSVRIGEMQKLSRLASSRVYKFGSAADRKSGKIEVFQRIGTCHLDIDTQNQEPRDVNIICSEAGFGNLRLRVGVENTSPNVVAQEDPEDALRKKKDKQALKVRSAKDYLQKTGV